MSNLCLHVFAERHLLRVKIDQYLIVIFSGQDFKYSYDGEQFYTDPAAASPTAGGLSPSGFGTVYFNNPYTTDETTLKEFVRKQM